MKILVIINDSPYGIERCYNGLRLANSLAKRDGSEVKVFLIGDAAGGARSGQKVPQGFYNVEVMLKNLARAKAEIGVCGTCIDARGIPESSLLEGSHRSTMEQLTDWTLWADKVLVF